ncbi:MAG: glutamate 5-kinase [Polyangiaceae bacterium]
MQERKALARARRIIVKVGSQSLADNAGLIQAMADEIAALSPRSFVLVSSGAIALGWKRLGYKRRPRETPELQASAAAGQSILMHHYEQAFARHGKCVAQVLLTHSDLSNRGSLNNARHALGALLDAGAIPIINENDTVATDEIHDRFGDNDQLASMIVPMVAADALILLTNVAGVLDAAGERISSLALDDTVLERRTVSGSQGTGGIQSKINAARKACRSGARAVIAPSYEPRVLERVLSGEDVGTLFEPTGNALRARKHWIAYTLRPRGTLVIDEGAVEAIKSAKKSLLAIGVLGVRGQFSPGDSVRLVAPDGSEVARGLTRLGAPEAARAAGRRDRPPSSSEDAESPPLVVHKDDLVLL